MIYIACPVDVATGGTEVLHQLHKCFNEQGYESRMVYIGKYEGSPVQAKFKHYEPIIADTIEDIKGNSLIVPETDVNYGFKYKNLQVAIWWLSVNNYKGASTPEKKNDFLRRTKRSLYNRKVMKRDKKWIHLVQSEHAKQYVLNEHSIDSKNILMLSDYLSEEHFKDCNENKRKPVVLYNPKKGFEFTKKLIEASPDIKWEALQNLTSEQMSKIMHTSKVYVDFGTHPGKDRIPREAAIAGCCIITGKMGSASNEHDLPIPSKMKFDQGNKNVSSILNMIYYCINNYEEATKWFDSYREKIRMEPESFKREVAAVGNRLVTLNRE